MHDDETNAPFYFHEESGQTSWEHPALVSSSANHSHDHHFISAEGDHNLGPKGAYGSLSGHEPEDLANDEDAELMASSRHGYSTTMSKPSHVVTSSEDITERSMNTDTNQSAVSQFGYSTTCEDSPTSALHDHAVEALWKDNHSDIALPQNWPQNEETDSSGYQHDDAVGWSPHVSPMRPGFGNGSTADDPAGMWSDAAVAAASAEAAVHYSNSSSAMYNNNNYYDDGDHTSVENAHQMLYEDVPASAVPDYAAGVEMLARHSIASAHLSVDGHQAETDYHKHAAPYNEEHGSRHGSFDMSRHSGDVGSQGAVHSTSRNSIDSYHEYQAETHEPYENHDASAYTEEHDYTGGGTNETYADNGGMNQTTYSSPSAANSSDYVSPDYSRLRSSVASHITQRDRSSTLMSAGSFQASDYISWDPAAATEYGAETEAWAPTQHTAENSERERSSIWQDASQVAVHGSGEYEADEASHYVNDAVYYAEEHDGAADAAETSYHRHSLGLDAAEHVDAEAAAAAEATLPDTLATRTLEFSTPINHHGYAVSHDFGLALADTVAPYSASGYNGDHFRSYSQVSEA